MDTFESGLSSYDLYHSVDINTEIENAFKIELFMNSHNIFSI